MDLTSIITAAGYFGITTVIFAESGLLIGFFLPGDSLLFTAGFLASTGVFSIWPLMALSTAAAIIGDSVGYAFGKYIGPRIFTRDNSVIFHRDHLERSRKFFDRHGSKAVVIARFMPVIRTFTPVLAGVGKMRYRTFLMYNIVGGLTWASGVPFVGYKLGMVIPNVDQYLIPIVAAIILASFMPSIIHLLRDAEERARAITFARNCWNHVLHRGT
ncbi:MAG: VTT domain-containing protein [Candidatus Uhrbacteria bacterium]